MERKKEVCQVFGSLTVVRTSRSNFISIPAWCEANVETWKLSNSNRKYGQGNSLLKESVENHCNRSCFSLKDEFGHLEVRWLDSVPYYYQSNLNPVQSCRHLAPKNSQKSLGRQHRWILKTWLFLRKPLQLLQLNIKLYWLQAILALRHFYSSLLLPEDRNTVTLFTALQGDLSN